MLITLKSPGSYIQDKDIIKNLSDYLYPFGKSAVVLISPSGIKRHKSDMLSGVSEDRFSFTFEEITAQCCSREIDRIVSKFRNDTPDMVIGVGGGKILDISKAAADALNTSCIIIPTVASTDAPCSALSVLYTPEGVFDKYVHTRRSPDAVLVDTQIIANAPADMLAAGMGDALSTYIEARAVKSSGSVSQLSTFPTAAAFALARCCFDTLMKYGREAYAAAKNKEVNFALERIVEANIYLSGVGFESGGVAAAHALQKGMTVIPQLHARSHGEKVAFNTIVQLCLEKAPEEELRKVIGFCRDIDLPVNFKELCDEPISREQWMEAAAFTCRPGMTIHKMPFEVTPEMLTDAIYEADSKGSCKY